MPKSAQNAVTIGALAVLCGLVSGIAGFVASLFALASFNWIGAGVCLGAAGLSFGLAANAAWRD